MGHLWPRSLSSEVGPRPVSCQHPSKKMTPLLAMVSPQNPGMKPEVELPWNTSLRIKYESGITHWLTCHWRKGNMHSQSQGIKLGVKDLPVAKSNGSSSALCILKLSHRVTPVFNFSSVTLPPLFFKTPPSLAFILIAVIFKIYF